MDDNTQSLVLSTSDDYPINHPVTIQAAKQYIEDWCPDHVKDYIANLESTNIPLQWRVEVIELLRKKYGLSTLESLNAADDLTALFSKYK